MYRFHLDIPLGEDQAAAIAAANNLIQILRSQILWDNLQPQIRLGNDQDRGAKNYLKMTEGGHATSGKIPLFGE